MVALLSKQRSKSRSEKLSWNGFLGMVALDIVASNIDLKTLWLLLRHPNIALVIVRLFRIDPQKSDNGATYSLIVG